MARSSSRSAGTASPGDVPTPARGELPQEQPSAQDPPLQQGWMWVLYLWLTAFLLLGLYDMTLLILNLLRGTEGAP